MILVPTNEIRGVTLSTMLDNQRLGILSGPFQTNLIVQMCIACNHCTAYIM